MERKVLYGRRKLYYTFVLVFVATGFGIPAALYLLGLPLSQTSNEDGSFDHPWVAAIGLGWFVATVLFMDVTLIICTRRLRCPRCGRRLPRKDR